MNVIILLWHYILKPDFLELLFHSVIAQCMLGLQDQNCGDNKKIIDGGEGSASRMVDAEQKPNICCNTWALCTRGKDNHHPCLSLGTVELCGGSAGNSSIRL